MQNLHEIHLLSCCCYLFTTRKISFPSFQIQGAFFYSVHMLHAENVAILGLEEHSILQVTLTLRKTMVASTTASGRHPGERASSPQPLLSHLAHTCLATTELFPKVHLNAQILGFPLLPLGASSTAWRSSLVEVEASCCSSPIHCLPSTAVIFSWLMAGCSSDTGIYARYNLARRYITSSHPLSG